MKRKLFDENDKNTIYKDDCTINDTADTNGNDRISTSIKRNECEKFQLLSVICHHGDSLEFGHYTTYIFNFKRRKWFLCNDNDIMEVSFESFIQNTASIGCCYFYLHNSN